MVTIWGIVGDPWENYGDAYMMKGRFGGNSS